MAYAAAADLVVGVHAAFILFAVFGAALLPRWPRLLAVHLAALAWGAWISASGSICPLTPLENRFRALAGQGGYEGGFLDRYITPLIYPEGLTRGTQLAYGLALVVINVALYARLFLARRRVRA